VRRADDEVQAPQPRARRGVELSRRSIGHTPKVPRSLEREVIASLLDTILDRTVLAGYTNVGYRLRRRTWRAGDLQPMGGETVLVTGATSGLGLAAAEGFARLGARVRLHADP
jgi:NADPH:quinone reductase-like Zn-dependent oxidoreductase